MAASTAAADPKMLPENAGAGAGPRPISVGVDNEQVSVSDYLWSPLRLVNNLFKHASTSKNNSTASSAGPSSDTSLTSMIHHIDAYIHTHLQQSANLSSLFSQMAESTGAGSSLWLPNSTLSTLGPTTGLEPGSGTVMNETDELMFEFHGYHVFSPVEIVFWFVMYGLIAFLAVTGNALVIYLVLTQTKLQNVPNYFIVNLAIADAITGLIAVPFKFQAALLQRWTLPPFMCQLLTFTETLSLSVSVFTLTGSAVDRFIVVLFPGRWKMTASFAITTLSLIWVFSIACSLPFGAFHLTIGFVNDTVPIPSDDVGTIYDPVDVVWRCMPIYATAKWWRWYNIYLTIIQYFVPLIIVDGAYMLIAYRVWVTEPVTTCGADRRFQKDRRKVVKLLVIVVTLFTFCWLPYETYLMLSEVRPNINMFFFINVIFMTSHCLAMSNSCINPIIYGIYNKRFQREYRRVFYRCFGLSDVSSSNATHHQLAVDGHVPATEMQTLHPGSRESPDGMQTPSVMEPNSTHHFISSELGR